MSSSAAAKKAWKTRRKNGWVHPTTLAKKRTARKKTAKRTSSKK